MLTLFLCVLAFAGTESAGHPAYVQIDDDYGDSATPFAITSTGHVAPPPTGYTYTGTGHVETWSGNTGGAVQFTDCSTTIDNGVRKLHLFGTSTWDGAGHYNYAACYLDLAPNPGLPPHNPVLNEGGDPDDDDPPPPPTSGGGGGGGVIVGPLMWPN